MIVIIVGVTYCCRVARRGSHTTAVKSTMAPSMVSTATLVSSTQQIAPSSHYTQPCTRQQHGYGWHPSVVCPDTQLPTSTGYGYPQHPYPMATDRPPSTAPYPDIVPYPATAPYPDTAPHPYTVPSTAYPSTTII